MFARVCRTLALALAIGLGTVTVAQAEPSLHEVYAAAQAGHVGEAQQMMRQVLRDHPGSAKAHYVAAEIDARAGDLASARQELATAERLDAGLAFAKPEAISALRHELAAARGESRLLPAVNSGPPVPWGAMLLVVLVAGAAWWAIRRRAATLPGPNGPYANAVPAPAPVPSGPMGYGGTIAPTGGSGLLGNLATGMAVGAGVVAGEELIRHMLEPGHHATADQWAAAPAPDLLENQDMGGSDFGVNDAGSWDVGGGDDWS